MLSRHFTFTLLFLSGFLLSSSLTAQEREVAVANFNLGSGQLCFPMQLSKDDSIYDVCLAFDPDAARPQFILNSYSAVVHDMAKMPYFSNEQGLVLPLVKFSNGVAFADVVMDVSLDSSTDEYTFTVIAARRLRYDLDHSAARVWNEALLQSIRGDLARPTVHARNLFHTAVAMYDAWAVIEQGAASNYLLGQNLHGFSCNFNGFSAPQNKQDAQRKAISYAAYQLLKHRFADAPDAESVMGIYEDLMLLSGFDAEFESTNYSSGSAAALGNYIAQCVIDYGLSDGANESNDYASLIYQPLNEPMFPERPGNTTLSDPDRWQPLSFEVFRDQSGNVFNQSTPEFVSPEWGSVLPFALQDSDRTTYQRDGAQWQVYHDPGSHALLKEEDQQAIFQWNFETVVHWSSHLDPDDGVLWDISPAASGNLDRVNDYPVNQDQMTQFFDQINGGDPSSGHALNPVTGQPYQSQLVPRGDYTRVLAEFWADGPDSETPPGHWFTIFNHVTDDPLLEKRIAGSGALVSDLEWDVKGYLVLGGAMHDSAVTAWGIKGYYDSSRPVSAIRHMAELGQRTSSSLPNYDPQGMGLVDGLIELVESGDVLAGDNDEHVGKLKLYTWRGPDFVDDPQSDYAGVGWILAENWWPYQRPTFVSPPFAGYLSGHSTFSRAAAEVMTLFTGSPYFPGGLGEFVAPKNEFLVFEEGPSVDVVLQWATYQDASDQTSLSRIWGGIHPPMDDIPGRLIGITIGQDAYQMAQKYFSGNP